MGPNALKGSLLALFSHVVFGSQFPTPEECLVPIVTDGGWIDILPAGTQCVFPFEVGGETFNECATLDQVRPFINGANRDAWNITSPTASANRWCATVSVYDPATTENQLRKQWGYCDCKSTSSPTVTPSSGPTESPTPSSASPTSHPTSSPVSITGVIKVGGDGVWAIKDYEDLEVEVGESVQFKYGSSHDVALVPNEAAFNNCDLGQADVIGQSGEGVGDGFILPITAKDAGSTLFVVCAQPGHCISGQKVIITVQGSTPPPVPSPTASPTGSPVVVPPSSPQYVEVDVRLIPIVDDPEELVGKEASEILDVSLLPALVENLFSVPQSDIAILSVHYYLATPNRRLRSSAGGYDHDISRDLVSLPKYQEGKSVKLDYQLGRVHSRRLQDSFFLVNGGIKVVNGTAAQDILDRAKSLSESAVTRELRGVQFTTSIESWKLFDLIPEALPTESTRDDDKSPLSTAFWVLLGITICSFFLVLLISFELLKQKRATRAANSRVSEVELASLQAAEKLKHEQSRPSAANKGSGEAFRPSQQPVQSARDTTPWTCDFCAARNDASARLCSQCNTRKTAPTGSGPVLQAAPNSANTFDLDKIAGGQLAAAWTASAATAPSHNEAAKGKVIFQDSDSDDSDDDTILEDETIPLTHISSLAPQLSTGSIAPLLPPSPKDDPWAKAPAVTSGPNAEAEAKDTASASRQQVQGGQPDPAAASNPFDSFSECASSTKDTSGISKPAHGIPGGLGHFDPLSVDNNRSADEVEISVVQSPAEIDGPVISINLEGSSASLIKEAGTSDANATGQKLSNENTVVPRITQEEIWDHMEVETVSDSSSGNE